MKPGKLCKETSKRNLGSEANAHKFAQKHHTAYRIYICKFCKCRHITTHDKNGVPLAQSPKNLFASVRQSVAVNPTVTTQQLWEELRPWFPAVNPRCLRKNINSYKAIALQRGKNATP